MSLADRLEAVVALGRDIDARREELGAACVRFMHVLPGVADGDVALAAERLRSMSCLAALVDGRRPAGAVAVMLPGNALLSNPVNTIGSAFVAGNVVRVRFPRRSAAWADVVAALISPRLTGVQFDDAPGPRFLTDAAEDPTVSTVVVFGDDRWASGYEALVRRTATKFVFEGGGNCPFLVLDDADVAVAARQLARGAFHNAGQACTSPERAYVHAAVFDRFLRELEERAAAQVMGDPGASGVTVGPIPDVGAAARLRSQLEEARKAGADVRVGGGVATGTLDNGAAVTWAEPTVVTGAPPSAAVEREETFGPLVSVNCVRDRASAVEAAASTGYGLAATVFGGGPAELATLRRSHGRVFHNELWLDHDRRELHAPRGGRGRSGWIWVTEGGSFVRRDGPHHLVVELSVAPPVAAPIRKEAMSHA